MSNSGLASTPPADLRKKDFAPSEGSAPNSSGAAESPVDRGDSTGLGRRGYNGLSRLGTLLPGLALAAGIGATATVLSDWIGIALLGYAQSPISAILLTILLGLVVRNTIGLPDIYEPGLQLCVKRILHIGVALLGIRLSLAVAGSTGLVALPIVIVCIAVALLLVAGLTRLLRLPRRLGSLIAVGTSICGITAIVAIAPVINADDDETSYAVATIALFGIVALFAYPFLAHFIFDSPIHAGLFLGTAIHDTSQVAGAGLAYQQQFSAPETLNTAVVTKLVRNLCMIGVIPLMGALYHRRDAIDLDSASAPVRRKGMVPLFILGFLAMTALRTIGDLGVRSFGFLEPDTWERAIVLFQQLAELALLLAMTAVGLRTSLRKLYVLGLRPLSVGLAAALCVGLVSALMIQLFNTLAIL